MALRARLVKCNKGANNTIRLNTRVPKSWTDAKGVLNSFSDLLLVCANADQCTDENDMHRVRLVRTGLVGAGVG